MNASILWLQPSHLRRSALRVAALALVWLGSPLSAATAAPAMTGPAVPGFETYDREITDLLERWQVPGAAVAVAVDGRIVFARGYGLADREAGRVVQPDTRFRLGSLSKPITAALTLKLVEQGRLALDDHAFPLLNYPTPAYAGAGRDPRLNSITVRQLLNHTAGWNRDTAVAPFPVINHVWEPTYYQSQIASLMGAASPASAETMARYLVGQPLQFAPGTGYAYSNIGYLYLGRLIALKTGKTYEGAGQEMFAEVGVSGARIGGSPRSAVPADEAVCYDYPGAYLLPSPFGEGQVARAYSASLEGLDAHGGWALSPIEYVRFMQSLDGANGTPRILQPASVAAMRASLPPAVNYGYGWALNYAYGESGHLGKLPGSNIGYGLRSSDGRVQSVVVFNSLPERESDFEVEVYQSLHAAEMVARAAPAPQHDLTWTTLKWDAWQRHYFGYASPDLMSGTDRDADGVPDLVEYAAGLDPTRCDSQPPATFSVRADGTPVFTYRRLVLEHPFSWVIESTTDGQNWTAASATGTQSALNADGTLSVSVPMPGAVSGRVRYIVHEWGGLKDARVEACAPARNVAVAVGGSATLSVAAPASATLQWRRNGTVIAGATGTSLTLTDIQPAQAGIYTVDISGGTRAMAVAGIVGIRSAAKVMGGGELVREDIRHANGNVYDQVLLTGQAATITADPNQVTRISYIDLDDDIVQVEFSGAGSLTLVLTSPAEPAAPVNYNQNVRYVKGHATIVLTDAGENTNVSVFSVGTGNAVDQSLFKPGVAYGGIAGIAALAIQSPTGKTAGLFLGNAHLFAAGGLTGLYASGVNVSGPVRLGDVSAFDRAEPMLVFGSLGELLVTGGDLKQDNSSAVQVQGIGRFSFVNGGKSDRTELPAQTNQAALRLNGVVVTAKVTE